MGGLLRGGAGPGRGPADGRRGRSGRPRRARPGRGRWRRGRGPRPAGSARRRAGPRRGSWSTRWTTRAGSIDSQPSSRASRTPGRSRRPAARRSSPPPVPLRCTVVVGKSWSRPTRPRRRHRSARAGRPPQPDRVELRADPFQLDHHRRQLGGGTASQSAAQATPRPSRAVSIAAEDPCCHGNRTCLEYKHNAVLASSNGCCNESRIEYWSDAIPGSCGAGVQGSATSSHLVWGEP